LNIQNWRTALIESEMTDKAKLVGLVLSVYWNNKGKIYPSLTTLENDCSLTKNTIIRAVAELTDNNFVTVTKEHHRKSSFKINTYLLTGVTVAPMNDTVNEPMIDRANEPMIDRANEPSIDSVAIAPMNAPELDIKVFKGIKEKDTIVSKKKDKPSGLLPVYFQFMILGLTPDKALIKAEKFYSHYQSNGWKVSKNPMKDWKAATSGTWCDFAKVVGYQKDHLCYVIEELEKQYGDRAEHDQFDFAKLKHDRPELFDREMFNNDWNKYLEGLND